MPLCNGRERGGGSQPWPRTAPLERPWNVLQAARATQGFFISIFSIRYHTFSLRSILMCTFCSVNHPEISKYETVYKFNNDNTFSSGLEVKAKYLPPTCGRFFMSLTGKREKFACTVVKHPHIYSKYNTRSSAGSTYLWKLPYWFRLTAAFKKQWKLIWGV